MTIAAATTEIGLTAEHPAAPLLDAIAAATRAGPVAEAGRRLPRTVTDLLESGGDALEIAGVVTGVIDAMTRRLIELAMADMGEPPVPWAWLALGSAARREQGLGTDQDHALAYDPQGRPLEAIDGYFLRVAEFVTTGLEDAGIPRCHADVVAMNQALRRPIEHWVEAFEGWMADPRIEAVRQTAILFDHRRVAGSLDVETTLHRTISTSPDRPAFVARLKAMAMGARPRRRLRRRRIDVKHDGIMQIVTLARILAVEGGISETGTIERLRGAAARGLLDERSADRLSAAFRFLWRIRLEHQVAVAASGAEPGEPLPITTTALRTRIDEVLRSIRTAQGALLRGSNRAATIHGDTRSPSLEPALRPGRELAQS